MSRLQTQSAAFRLKRKPLGWAIASLLATSAFGSAQAATIRVAPEAVKLEADGICSLPEAVINANKDSRAGSVDCARGSGDDVIELAPDSTYVFFEPDRRGRALPLITTKMTIKGNGAAIYTNPSDPFGVIGVLKGDLTLDQVDIAAGEVRDGSGGCILVNKGRLRLQESTVSHCRSFEGGAGIHASQSTLEIAENSRVSDTRVGFYGGPFSSGAGVRADASSVTIEDSTIRNNAYARNSGSDAIRISTGALVIRRSVVSENDGSGVVIKNCGSGCEPSSVIIDDSEITNNGWNGIRCDSRSTLTVNDSMVSRNGHGGINAFHCALDIHESSINGNRYAGIIHERFGGGEFESNLTVQNSTISNNGYTGLRSHGDGRSNDSSSVSISGSTFEANRIAGLRFTEYSSSEVSIVNSTISGNDGGGLQALFWNSNLNRPAAEFRIVNSTFIGNESSEANSGDDILISDIGAVFAEVSVYNTIFGSSQHGTACKFEYGRGRLANNVNNAMGDFSCLAGAENYVFGGYELNDLRDNGGPTETHMPTPSSSTIGAANPKFCPPKDQRGVRRGTKSCDVGAVEHRYPTLWKP